MCKKYKGMAMLLCILMITSIGFIPVMQANAEEVTVIEEESWENTDKDVYTEDYNISTIPPVGDEEISTRTTERPASSKVINLKTQDMTFSGVAEGSKLYTNSNFTGASSVRITVTNDCDNVLTYHIYKNGIVDTKVKTINVQSGYTVASSISGLSSSSLYYIRFDPPSDFSGSVKRIG